MRHLSLVLVLSLPLVVLACGPQAETGRNLATPAPQPTTGAATAPEVEQGRVASTELMFKAGTPGHVTATFTEEASGVRVVVEAHQVTPGDHGLHLHVTGDCSAPDFSSAGDHFNPASAAHGGPDSAERHAGDLGNLAIGEDGTGRLELVVAGLTVAEGANSVVGKALVLHEKADDMKTQPTGGSGGRIACGVVRETPAQPQQM